MLCITHILIISLSLTGGEHFLHENFPKVWYSNFNNMIHVAILIIFESIKPCFYDRTGSGLQDVTHSQLHLKAGVYHVSNLIQLHGAISSLLLKSHQRWSTQPYTVWCLSVLVSFFLEWYIQISISCHSVHSSFTCHTSCFIINFMLSRGLDGSYTVELFSSQCGLLRLNGRHYVRSWQLDLPNDGSRNMILLTGAVTLPIPSRLGQTRLDKI